MIPLKLEITNFLSYRETAVLDFNGIHLACISGANGAGKSSILDAMTWVLFGQSRSRSDDDLVNRVASFGGDGADVSLIFELEGTVYRIFRRKKAGKRTVLELQMATDADHIHWKTLSEGKLRDTQAAIENLLRMNYDTFVNASFLLQGKADEFTTKTPNRRKEILAELLGVNAWDQYKELATNRRKETDNRLLLLDGQLAEIEAEMGEEGTRREALEAAQAEQTVVSERLADKEALLGQLRRVESAVSQQKQLLQNLANTLAQAQKTETGLKETRQKRGAERESFQAILDNAVKIQAAFAAWQTADDELQSWQVKANDYNRLQQAKRPYELAVTQARSKLEQEVQTFAAQEERVSQAESERETVTQTLTVGQARLVELQTAVTNLAAQEGAWHEARSALQELMNERKLRAQELEQLRVQARRVGTMADEKTAVVTNAAQAEAELADLTNQIVALAEQHKQHAIGRAEMDSLKADQPRLRQEMNRLKERLDGLDVETGGQCPLCGQPLSDDHRQEVLAQLQADGDDLGARFRANKERLDTLGSELAALESQLKRGERLERDQKMQRDRLAKAEARLTEIDKAVHEWEGSGQAARMVKLEDSLSDDTAVTRQQALVDDLATAVGQKAALDQVQKEKQQQISQAEARLSEIERIVSDWEKVGRQEQVEASRRLETGDYASDDQTALSDLEEQIDAVGYDVTMHESARTKQDQFADAPMRQQELKQAEAAVKPLADTLSHLDEQLAAQEGTINDLERQHQTAAIDLETLAADSGDMKGIEAEVFRLREEQVGANRRVGAAQQWLDVLEDLRKRRKTLGADRAEITLEIQRLKLLEKACGRDGVQALLIEQALPEIEDHANELLDRLTNGDMRVSFETQRQLKSREGMAETLDIRIIDSAGERPYANFSGGEQFRINFAIRLALSQILAKRAGVRLQTLVIDEGFGSQDPNGRQRLIEAINAIQDDFVRILVITHIDELRDVFPTRIEVEKAPTGSTINVI